MPRRASPRTGGFGPRREFRRYRFGAGFVLAPGDQVHASEYHRQQKSESQRKAPEAGRHCADERVADRMNGIVDQPRQRIDAGDDRCLVEPGDDQIAWIKERDDRRIASRSGVATSNSTSAVLAKALGRPGARDHRATATTAAKVRIIVPATMRTVQDACQSAPDRWRVSGLLLTRRVKQSI